MSDGVLPGPRTLILIVGEPVADVVVDIIETDGLIRVRVYRQHDQLLVTEAWFVRLVFSWFSPGCG